MRRASWFTRASPTREPQRFSERTTLPGSRAFSFRRESRNRRTMGPATNVGGRKFAAQHRARGGTERSVPTRRLCLGSRRPCRLHLVQALEVPCESHVRRRTTRPRRSISFPAIGAGLRSAVRLVVPVASSASRHTFLHRRGRTLPSPALRAVALPVILRELLRERLWQFRVSIVRARALGRLRVPSTFRLALTQVRVMAVTPEHVRS
jgi:hypothetical protein